MKKLFVSVPMKDRTKENIKSSIDKMHKIAELMFGEELEVLDSYFEDKIPARSDERIYCLSKSIEKLSEADYFIGIEYYHEFPGCCIEADIATRYRIPAIYLNFNDCRFFDDVKAFSGRFPSSDDIVCM